MATSDSPTPDLEPAGQAPNPVDGKVSADPGLAEAPASVVEPAAQAPGAPIPADLL